MEGRGEAYQLFVGVDIAADTFTAAWLPTGSPSSAPFTGDRTPPGFAALQRRLQATGVPPATTLVVLEATGNYWVVCWPFSPSAMIFLAVDPDECEDRAPDGVNDQHRVSS